MFRVKKIYEIKVIGTTSEWVEIVECPQCKHEFARTVTEGCFHRREDPLACPECRYPFNIKDINPSRRKQIE